MHLTVCRAIDEGITNFLMIHDSYGTHAADAERLSKILREVFIDMYQRHDVLSELWAPCRGYFAGNLPDGFPEQPERGTLNLDLIKDCEFFFC